MSDIVTDAAHRLFTAVLLLLVVAVSACEPPVEGCTDPAASDFNPTAEKKTTCTYPKLLLTMQYVYNSHTFTPDSVFTTGLGAVSIDSVCLLVSNLRLERTLDFGYYEANVDETTNFRTLNGNTILSGVPDNFTAISTVQPAAQTVGSFRGLGVFDMLRFTVGLDSLANHADHTTRLATHALSPKHTNPTLYNTTTKTVDFLRLHLHRDTNGDGIPDTPFVLRLTDDAYRATILMGYEVAVKRGTDTPITLTLDCKKLLNLPYTQPDAVILAALRDNLKTAFKQ